jgi:hypothetical protein
VGCPQPTKTNLGIPGGLRKPRFRVCQRGRRRSSRSRSTDRAGGSHGSFRQSFAAVKHDRDHNQTHGPASGRQPQSSAAESRVAGGGNSPDRFSHRVSGPGRSASGARAPVCAPTLFREWWYHSAAERSTEFTQRAKSQQTRCLLQPTLCPKIRRTQVGWAGVRDVTQLYFARLFPQPKLCWGRLLEKRLPIGRFRSPPRWSKGKWLRVAPGRFKSVTDRLGSMTDRPDSGTDRH